MGFGQPVSRIALGFIADVATGISGIHGYQDLVELETGKLIEVEAGFQSDQGHSQRGPRIDLESFLYA